MSKSKCQMTKEFLGLESFGFYLKFEIGHWDFKNHKVRWEAECEYVQVRIHIRRLGL